MAYDDKSSNSPSSARRNALRALGGGALVVLASTVLSGTAMAQVGGRPEIQAALKSGVTLSKLNAAQVNALQLTRRAPGSTSISKMGLTAEGVAKLSPAARSLTKRDLELLGRGDVKSPTLAKLTVSDIASIREAFGAYYRPGIGDLAALDISCCCCTPCCCAVAVSEPLALAA